MRRFDGLFPFALALLLCLTVSAYGESWQLLKSGEGVASLYLDTASLTDKDGLRFFWLKSEMTYANKRQPKDRKRSMHLHHALNCATKEVYPPVEMRLFDGEGKLVDQAKRGFETIKTGKKNILELTAGDKVYKGVCGQGK